MFSAIVMFDLSDMSKGYAVALYPCTSPTDNTIDTNSEIASSYGGWQFFYKEGALVLDLNDKVGSANFQVEDGPNNA